MYLNLIHIQRPGRMYTLVPLILDNRTCQSCQHCLKILIGVLVWLWLISKRCKTSASKPASCYMVSRTVWSKIDFSHLQ